MPSKLMTVSEALQYAKIHGYKGIKVEGNYLIYTNSNGKKSRVRITKDLLIYYRGRGRWAVYNPIKDAKIVSHKLRVKVKDPKKWAVYGDINPEYEPNRMKEVIAKVGRGKGIKKKVKRRLPVGGGKKSL